MVNPMPNPAESSPLDHYTALEAAYRQGDWAAVLEQGSVLNRKLTRAGGAQAQALRQRLELMLAHTHLYGFGNGEAAQQHYQALLNQPVDAALRQMAQEGLQTCRERIAAAAAAVSDDDVGAEESAEPTAQPRAATDGEAATTAAEPWLADLANKTDTSDKGPSSATTSAAESSERPSDPEIGRAHV